MHNYPFVYTLRRGSLGQVVRDLQGRLGISRDGAYGPVTEQAVRDFQKSRGLAVDGIAGPKTLTALQIPVRSFIDVSHHQGRIDWPSVPKDLAFVVVKLSEGLTFKDPRFQENVRGARAAGFQVYGYHYAKPGNNLATAEAQEACKAAGDVPVWLDLEDAGNLKPAALQAWATAFLQEVRRIQGHTPVLYTGSAFLQFQLGGGGGLNQWPLWIARYSGRTDDPGYIGSFDRWMAWQYSSKGRVPGISKAVDVNWLPTDPTIFDCR